MLHRLAEQKRAAVYAVLSELVQLDTLIPAEPDFCFHGSSVCWSVAGLQAPADGGLSLARGSGVLAVAIFETAGCRPLRNSAPSPSGRPLREAKQE